MAARNRRKRLRLILILVSAVLSVALVAYVLSILGQYRGLRAERAQLQKKLEEEKLSTQLLQEELDYTQTSDFIERAAREKLGWIKPGEIRIVAEENGQTPAPEASPTPMP